MSTYEFNNLMAGALAAEQRGNNIAAARYFGAAAKRAAEPADKVHALHAAGVNWRIAGMTAFAMNCFNEAESRANEAGLLYLIDSIRLDSALALIDQGELLLARNIITYVLKGTEDDLIRVTAEFFLGRLRLSRGDLCSASRHFMQARNHLGRVKREGSEGYRRKALERDLLIWQMKVLSWPRRAFTGLRAIWLALSTGYPRRAVEAVILAMPFGRGLYKRVRKHH